MLAFLGSWFLAWFLGGGLIFAVILYVLFFKKNSLASLAFAFVKSQFRQPKISYNIGIRV